MDPSDGKKDLHANSKVCPNGGSSLPRKLEGSISTRPTTGRSTRSSNCPASSRSFDPSLRSRREIMVTFDAQRLATVN
eukprot:2822909-Rhodomonas_salina.3